MTSHNNTPSYNWIERATLEEWKLLFLIWGFPLDRIKSSQKYRTMLCHYIFESFVFFGWLFPIPLCRSHVAEQQRINFENNKTIFRIQNDMMKVSIIVSLLICALCNLWKKSCVSEAEEKYVDKRKLLFFQRFSVCFVSAANRINMDFSASRELISHRSQVQTFSF